MAMRAHLAVYKSRQRSVRGPVGKVKGIIGVSEGRISTCLEHNKPMCPNAVNSPFCRPLLIRRIINRHHHDPFTSPLPRSLSQLSSAELFVPHALARLQKQAWKRHRLVQSNISRVVSLLSCKENHAVSSDKLSNFFVG